VRHAVILAGGSGTRLWPASRRAKPKQLLDVAGRGEPLIAGAIAIGRAIAGERVAIVVGESQVEATRSVARDVRLIPEPLARNTAAAIGLAAATIRKDDDGAVLAVLPADHHVADRPAFESLLANALAHAESTDDVVTLGITPTHAETGYGYLEVGALDKVGPQRVVRFIEKPDAARARELVDSHRYLWNAGIFCLTARRLLAELDAHLPTTAHAVREIAAGRGRAVDLFAALPSISIDKGVMEKTDRIVAFPADVGWNDVGSWAALAAVRGVDASGNTIGGTAVVVDGTGNVVIGDDATLVATVGVSNLVVIKSGDAILVVPKDRAQDVKKVIDMLGARALARYL
jgi:mannose-1-phosphate guanylyltransferase